MSARITRLAALAVVVAAGLTTIVGSGGGGGESGSPPPAVVQPAALTVTAGPHSKAWTGETYESSVAAVASTGEPLEYRLGAQAPAGLNLELTTGALRWMVPAVTSPGKQTFDITVRATASGASLTQAVSIEVLVPNVVVDAAVGSAGAPLPTSLAPTA